MSSVRLISPPLQGLPESGAALADNPRSKLHKQLVVLSEKCNFSIPLLLNSNTFLFYPILGDWVLQQFEPVAREQFPLLS